MSLWLSVSNSYTLISKLFASCIEIVGYTCESWIYDNTIIASSQRVIFSKPDSCTT